MKEKKKKEKKEVSKKAFWITLLVFVGVIAGVILTLSLVFPGK